MERKVMILSAGVGSGHNSAAAALQRVVANRPDVSTVTTLDVLTTTPGFYRAVYDDGYFEMVARAPWLVGWGYDQADGPFQLGSRVPWWDQINTTETVAKIKEFSPDLVLATHFLPARIVANLQTSRDLFTRLAIITTDYDVQGLWLTNTFSRIFLAREESRQYLISSGFPEDRLTASGIPVRYEFGQQVDRAAVLATFGLREGVPILLISAGAAGGAYALRIVQQMQDRTEPFQAVVVCGHNADLKQDVDALVRHDTDRFHVLGYTTAMPDLMRVASLFIGKPGGLSSSEAMAAGLPMALINPIPGQEVRNSDYLLEQGAAVRNNYETTIGWKLGELLGDPARLARMRQAAVVTGRPAAATTVAEQMLADRDGQLWISDKAQRSLREASHLDKPERPASSKQRLRTLFDAESGRSAALITDGQLTELSKVMWASGHAMTLERSRLREISTLQLDPTLITMLRNVLGHRSAMKVTID